MLAMQNIGVVGTWMPEPEIPLQWDNLESTALRAC